MALPPIKTFGDTSGPKPKAADLAVENSKVAFRQKTSIVKRIEFETYSGFTRGCSEAFIFSYV